MRLWGGLEKRGGKRMTDCEGGSSVYEGGMDSLVLSQRVNVHKKIIWKNNSINT